VEHGLISHVTQDWRQKWEQQKDISRAERSKGANGDVARF